MSLRAAQYGTECSITHDCQWQRKFSSVFRQPIKETQEEENIARNITDECNPQTDPDSTDTICTETEEHIGDGFTSVEQQVSR